jgi:hypothetical protein
LTSAAAPAAKRVVITSVVKCSMAIMPNLPCFGVFNRTTHTTEKSHQAKDLFVRYQPALWDEEHAVVAMTRSHGVWRRVQ